MTHPPQALQILDLIFHEPGFVVSSELQSRTGIGDDIEHRLEISDGVSRIGVVIVLTKLKATAQPKEVQS